ncbi:autotransporter-associated beta strand repeat-containing protein [Roseateles noduli]|uniref:autotransporter outer membrane beta-barrel domain-containing protein n=1 Tax=Roseateles noduli TaxID=2052484 RepID=UPI003D645FEE
MSAPPRPRSSGKSGTIAGVRRSRLGVAIGAMSLACWVSGPATASADNGVAPGTGGEGRLGPSPFSAVPNNFTGTGGDAGGQAGSPGINRVRNNSVNGTGGQGYGLGPNAPTVQGGAVGLLISTDTGITALRLGGNGQDGPDAGFLRFHGASGGGGGAGVFATSSLALELTAAGGVAGGNGGAGGTGQPGSTNSAKGGGGGGGNGITMSGGGLLTNAAILVGGAGGRGAGSSDISARAAGGGGGGHAVEGANLTIINRGTLTGGVGGASGGYQAQAGEDGAAVHWSGGDNLLRLQSGSVINGALWVGTGATATLSVEAAVAPMTGWLLLDGNATIDTAADLSLGGPVTGAGRLTKTGDAVLTLSGNNSFSGGLTIGGGEVRASAPTLGTGAIRNDALLRIDTPTDAALQQDLTGSGRWIKQGSAALTLGGTTRLDGPLDIAQGQLAIGATGTLAAAALALTGADSVLDLSATAGVTTIGGLDGVAGSTIRTGAAALVAGDASDHAFSGTVTGPGALEKRGSGTLTLAGANTHAGGTTISDGALVGSAASFGSGAIVDNAVLRIDQSTDADWVNAVSGVGSVEKRGAGSLTLQQAIDVAGGLRVVDGRIVAAQQALLGAGAVTVGGQGQVVLILAADTALRHIGGDGLVAVDLGDTNRLLTMSAVPAGATAFTGTLVLDNAGLALTGPGAESLSAAALRVEAGGRLLAGADTGSIGTLRMNGGSIRFTPAATDDATSLRPLLITRSLDLSGSGTVQVELDLHGAPAADSMGPLLARDDGVSLLLARSAPGGQVLGDGAGLGLVGIDGQAVGNTTVGEIVQGGQRVALTSTRYGLSTGAARDGLYLTARLLGVDVLADRALTLSAPADADGTARELSVPLGGAGGVAIDAGSGRTIHLSSLDNTYAGGTRLVTGTLSLAGGSLPEGSVVTFEGAGTGLDLGAAGRPQRLGGLDGGDASGRLRLGAQTLTLETVGDHAFAGTIDGTGALVKTGPGTQTLTGNNTYGGGTTINAGTLVGSASSFGGGDIRNDGTLILDQAVDGTLANTISGGGTVSKQGAGTLTLGSAITGPGPLRIEAGTLRTDLARLGTGPLVNNAVLELDVPRGALLDSRLSGTGQLVKTGAGDLTLEGAQAAGGISVRTGGLIIGAAADGSALLRGNVDIGAGARLQGNGTIDGNARVSRDATLQLQAASAALRVRGDLHLDPGGRLNVPLDATSREPALIVGGKTTVAGASLHVDAKDGEWRPNQRVELLRSDAVDGRFSAVETNLAFLTPAPDYTSQGIALVMRRNQVSFVDLAQTPNQKGVAGSLVSHEDTAPASDLLVKLPRNEVGVALEDLAGGLQAGGLNAPALAAAQQRLALNRQLRNAPGTRTPTDSGRGLWATVYESRGTLVGDAVDTLGATTDGLLFGLDLWSAQDARLGVAIGADRQTLGSQGDDRADVRSGSLALYGGLAWHGFNLRGALSYAQSRVQTGRVVVSGGSVASLKAIERARHAEGFIEVGLPARLPVGQIEPFFQAGRFVTWAGGFNERGDDAAALSGGKARDSRSFGMAGLHGNIDGWVALGASWGLHATAAVQHLAGPATVTRRVRLTGADSFVTSAPSGAGTGVLAELGLTVQPRRGMTLALHATHGETGGSRENSVRVQGVWQY